MPTGCRNLLREPENVLRLVRFCHPAVIESYREHPDHVAFADNRFRPVAGERISVDYQTVELVALRSNVVEHSIRKGAILSNTLYVRWSWS